MDKMEFINELAEHLDEARYTIDDWNKEEMTPLLYLLQQLQDELEIIQVEE